MRAFLLEQENELTLIDTLLDTDGQQILDQIHVIHRQVSDLKRILLTHAHCSHLGGMAALQRLSGATVCAHQWEADIIAGDRKPQSVSFLPQPPYRTYHLQLGLALGLGRHPLTEVDRTLEDGDRVGPVVAIHTPGHTPGSLSFYWPERKVLFTGDVVVSWPRVEAGWDGFTLNDRQNRESLGQLSDLNDAEVLGVGHGEPILQGGAACIRSLLNGLKPRSRYA